MLIFMAVKKDTSMASKSDYGLEKAPPNMAFECRLDMALNRASEYGPEKAP